MRVIKNEDEYYEEQQKLEESYYNNSVEDFYKDLESAISKNIEIPYWLSNRLISDKKESDYKKEQDKLDREDSEYFESLIELEDNYYADKYDLF